MFLHQFSCGGDAFGGISYLKINRKQLQQKHQVVTNYMVIHYKHLGSITVCMHGSLLLNSGGREYVPYMHVPYLKAGFLIRWSVFPALTVCSFSWLDLLLADQSAGSYAPPGRAEPVSFPAPVSHAEPQLVECAPKYINTVKPSEQHYLWLYKNSARCDVIIYSRLWVFHSGA